VFKKTSSLDVIRLRGVFRVARGARPHFLQQTNRDFTDFSKIED
jgi:hypothetical protein